MKKHLSFLSALMLTAIALSFVSTPTVRAADEMPAPCPEGSAFCPLAPIPGLTEAGGATTVVESQNLASFFNNLYTYLIGLAAAAAVVQIIWGGLEISTKDSVSKQSDGKARIQQALFGLVLVLSPVLVFSIINPSILNLSLNLQPLDTATVPVEGSGATSTELPPAPEKGCLPAPNSGPYLEKRICASAADAQKDSCSNPKLSLFVPVQYNNCPDGLFDSNNNCLNPGNSVITYCRNVEPTPFLVYQYYSTYTPAFTSWLGTYTVIDTAASNTFTAGCRANGGVAVDDTSYISGKISQIIDRCPEGNNYVVDKSKASGVACFYVNRYCSWSEQMWPDGYRRLK